METRVKVSEEKVFLLKVSLHEQHNLTEDVTLLGQGSETGQCIMGGKEEPDG